MRFLSFGIRGFFPYEAGRAELLLRRDIRTDAVVAPIAREAVKVYPALSPTDLDLATVAG